MLHNKMNLRNILLLIALSACGLSDVKGQEELQLRKNIIHASASSVPLAYAGLNYYLERIILEKEKTAYFGKVGYGHYNEWEGSGQFYLLQAGVLMGVKDIGIRRSHLELGLGVAQLDGWNNKVPYNSRHFAFSIGWRIQKPGSRFIFRTGVSLPETIYVGVGLAF